MHDQGYFGGSSGSHVTISRDPQQLGPQSRNGAWGTDNGEPQRRDPSMEAAANLQGQEGCDASEVDHRWASPRTTKAHTVAVKLDVFFTSSLFFFSAIGHGS